MSIEVRNVAPGDHVAAIDVISTAFLERPDTVRVAETAKELWEPSRTWVATDGGRICGTFRSWPTEVTVPGHARLPAAAVAAVTVLPTHRRRGVLTRMAAAEHAAIRERGEAIALLYASEYTIYGRFGYGPGTRVGTWLVNKLRTQFHAARDDGGTVELVQPDEASRDRVRDLYDAWRRTRVSELRRRDHTWDQWMGLREDTWGKTWKGFLVFHRDAAGVPDGYARYAAEFRPDDHMNRIEVQDVVGLTEAAESALWSFIGSVDLVGSIRAENRSPADPLPWRLTNARAAALTDVGDAMWVRLFDVPRALAARSYEHRGAISLEVVDETAVGGRWRLALDASPDGATCVPTDHSPDLTIPVTALGSVYLGGNDLRDVVIRTGADEHRAGALVEAARLFRTLREPWCSTFF